MWRHDYDKLICYMYIMYNTGDHRDMIEPSNNNISKFCLISIIFTHLKLWIASARHNFKWVKILAKEFGDYSVNGLLSTIQRRYSTIHIGLHGFYRWCTFNNSAVDCNTIEHHILHTCTFSDQRRQILTSKDGPRIERFN